MPVWIWDIEGSLGDLLGDAPNRVTEVFRRTGRPSRDALVLGLSTHPETGQRLVLVAGFAGRPQQIATGKDRISIASLTYLDSIEVQDVQALLPEQFARALSNSLDGLGPLTAVRLTPALGREMVNRLRTLSSDFDELIYRSALVRQPVREERGARLREERDAVGLAVEFSGMRLTPNDLLAPGADASTATSFMSLLESVSEDNEDDLITADIQRFDPSGELVQYTGSRARFTDGLGLALTIMNVNRRPIESALGVDLVYWDEFRNVFTLVQYKRLRKRDPGAALSDTNKWTYTKRSDIVKALELMDLGGQSIEAAADWRMTSNPFWFKFVRTDVFKPDDMAILPGMYVAADFLRLALADNSLASGPRGGFEISYSNSASISRSVFVELVRKGIVGTTSSQTEHVVRLIKSLASENAVMVALKTVDNTTDDLLNSDGPSNLTLDEMLDF